MAHDALDPGPLNKYPHFPRRPSTGEPLWSDRAETDGVPVEGVTPMPRGLRTLVRRHGREHIVVDVTPYRDDGQPVNPPTLPPGG